MATVRDRMRRISSIVSVAAAGLTMGLVACGSDSETGSVAGGSWGDVVAAAEDEGTLNVYTVSPPLQIERMTEAFNEAYPDIKVNMTLGSGELVARVESEMQGGAVGGDVFLFSDPTFFTKHTDDILRLQGPNVEKWPAEAWKEDGKAPIPTQYPWTVFVWNTEIFPEGFKTWDDLLSPEVKGRLGVLDYVSPALVTTADWMQKELGEDYFADMSKLSPKRYNSAVVMGQAVASGEVGVAYLSTPSIVQGLEADGAPVESATPEAGFALEWGGGALKAAENPNAALVFMDWLLSPEGQEAVNGDGLGASALPDVPGAVDLGDSWEVFDPTTVTPESTDDYQDFITKYFGGVSS